MINRNTEHLQQQKNRIETPLEIGVVYGGNGWYIFRGYGRHMKIATYYLEIERSEWKDTRAKETNARPNVLFLFLWFKTISIM